MAAPEPIDWNDLRHFLAAARAGSLAGAARALGVEHTTVGRRLRALERSLGAALVLRRPDGLVLTPVGDRVREAAEAMEQAVAQASAAARQRGQRVRLAVPSGLAPVFTARLAPLAQATPPVALEVAGSARRADLAAGEADLAVRVGPVDDPELVSRPLGRLGWSLYAAPAYLARRPLAAEPLDLRGHELVGFDALLGGTPAGRWIARQLAAGARLAMRGREVADVVGAASAGAGVALLPCCVAEGSGALVRLTPRVVLVSELALAYRRELRGSGAMRAVIDRVIAACEEARALLAGEIVEAGGIGEAGETADAADAGAPAAGADRPHCAVQPPSIT